MRLNNFPTKLIIFLIVLVISTTAAPVVSAVDNDIDSLKRVGMKYKDNLKIYDIQAKYYENPVFGKIPGVRFKIKNVGNKTVDEIEITVYFKDKDGSVVTEKKYTPILSSEFNLDINGIVSNVPLKPGYIYQPPGNIFLPAQNVPNEWKEGSIVISITNIVLSENSDTKNQQFNTKGVYENKTKNLNKENNKNNRYYSSQTAETKSPRYDEELNSKVEKVWNMYFDDERQASNDDKLKDEAVHERSETEEAMQKQLAEEQKAQDAAHDRQDMQAVYKYGERIKQAIRNKFNDVGLPEGLSCVFVIRMIPGGEVVESRIEKSSGNAVFDRRAEIALMKAAPLPVPDNPRIFDKMREIRLTFYPE